jgi:hypothetical protein
MRGRRRGQNEFDTVWQSLGRSAWYCRWLVSDRVRGCSFQVEGGQLHNGRAMSRRTWAMSWVLVVGGSLTIFEVWRGEKLGAVLVLVLVLAGLGLSRRLTKPEFEEAEYGIPHCRVERNADGFTASFSSVSRHTMALRTLLMAFIPGAGFILVGLGPYISIRLFWGLVIAVLATGIGVLGVWGWSKTVVRLPAIG